MTSLKCCATGIALLAIGLTASAQTPKIVISQFYGGAGCGTANCSTYKNDYIEIYNSGSAPQNLNGWSVQYTSATGTAWQVTNLTNFTLQPGQYYLIAEGAGANGTNSIPTPDASGTIAMSAIAAKIAVVNTTVALSGACPLGPTVVDFVGYGATASCNEGGSNAPAPSTTTADVRAGNGCTDAGVNSTDFTATTPNARNTATSIAPCTVLPVSFVSFRAQYQAATNSVAISWSTAQEQNAREFVVERSTDGTAWTIAARAAATGNTNATTSYSATDLQPQQGTNLYRIRQVDVDGRSTYTGIIGVKTSAKSFYFRAFPNPTEGTVYINAALAASAPVRIRVTDMSGRVLLTEQRVFNAAQPLKVDLSAFGRGVYFVALASGEFTGTEKVTVY